MREHGGGGELHYSNSIVLICISGFLLGTWSSPTVRGARPPPCHNFSFTKVDDHHAVLFGGWDQKNHRRTNDVYSLDLTRMVSYSLLAVACLAKSMQLVVI